MERFQFPPIYCSGADREGDKEVIHLSALNQMEGPDLSDTDRRKIQAAMRAYDQLNPGYHVSTISDTPAITKHDMQSICPRLEAGKCITRFPNVLAGDSSEAANEILEVRSACRMLIPKLALLRVITKS